VLLLSGKEIGGPKGLGFGECSNYTRFCVYALYHELHYQVKHDCASIYWAENMWVFYLLFCLQEK